MGLTKTGKSPGTASASRLAMGKISLGPSEQLMPTALAPRPRAVAAKLPTVQPVKVRPLASKLMLAMMGRVLFSLAASRAAFISYRSVNVSK